MRHYSPYVGSSEEVTSEDGRFTYWRVAVPLPYFTSKFFFKSAYTCGCGKKFNSMAEYELHYRKAYYEEEMTA